jgi:hypothetical protein
MMSQHHMNILVWNVDLLYPQWNKKLQAIIEKCSFKKI